MTMFQVRNKRTKMVLGEVDVDDPASVLDALATSTGCSIDDIAAALGSTVEEAQAALDIVVLKLPVPAATSVMKPKCDLRRRQLYS